MDKGLAEKLISLDVNLNITLERFMGNEDLFIRCLKKLLNDKNFDAMQEAIAQSDVKAAFEATHALKGVTANLGLDRVYKEFAELTEVFRAGSMDYNHDNMDRAVKAYKEAIEMIMTIE